MDTMDTQWSDKGWASHENGRVWQMNENCNTWVCKTARKEKSRTSKKSWV